MSKLKLGIDFGSTYTYIFAMDDKGDIKNYYPLLRNVYEGLAGIPTQIFHNGNEVLIGHQAVETKQELQSIKDSLRKLFEDGQKRLRKDVKDAQQEATAFFKTLFERMGVNVKDADKESMGIKAADIESIVCGMPAPTATNSDPSQGIGTDWMTYSSTIQEIFTDVFEDFKDDWKKIHFECIEEPILACAGAIKDGLICEGDNVLVIDLGGGTNDFAYVKHQSDGKYKVEACRGGQGPGGNAYDIDIQDELNNDSRFNGMFTSPTILTDIKRVKEDVFKNCYKGKGKSSVKLTSDDGKEKVILTYNESIDDTYLDIAVKLKKSFDRVVSAVKRFCCEKIKNDDEINKVLFAGGCSHIGPLTDMIEQCLNQYFNRKLTYVHIKDDYGIDTTSLSNSNAVAYGALFYDDIEIEKNEAINQPSGWQFKVSNQKVEMELEFFKHPTCGWVAVLSVDVMRTTYAGTYQQKIKIAGMKEIIFNYNKAFRFWLFKDSMIKEDCKRLPKNGSYGITLEEGLNRLKIFIVHTINFQFFVFIFNGEGDYEGFEIWPHVALDKTSVRCLMYGENDDNKQKESDAKDKKKISNLDEKDIKEILEDYSNGEKITI